MIPAGRAKRMDGAATRQGAQGAQATRPQVNPA